MATGFTIKLSGPIFEANVSAQVQGVVKQGLEKLALKGQAMVQEQLYPGHGVVTGNLRRSVVGQAETWQHASIGTPVSYGAPVEYGHHSFQGYHMFAQAADKLAALDISSELGSLIVGKLS